MRHALALCFFLVLLAVPASAQTPASPRTLPPEVLRQAGGSTSVAPHYGDYRDGVPVTVEHVPVTRHKGLRYEAGTKQFWASSVAFWGLFVGDCLSSQRAISRNPNVHESNGLLRNSDGTPNYKKALAANAAVYGISLLADWKGDGQYHYGSWFRWGGCVVRAFIIARNLKQ